MARVHNCGNTSSHSWDVIGCGDVDGLGVQPKVAWCLAGGGPDPDRRPGMETCAAALRPEARNAASEFDMSDFGNHRQQLSRRLQLSCICDVRACVETMSEC
jgi:hypothetical protein